MCKFKKPARSQEAKGHTSVTESLRFRNMPVALYMCAKSPTLAANPCHEFQVVVQGLFFGEHFYHTKVVISASCDLRALGNWAYFILTQLPAREDDRPGGGPRYTLPRYSLLVGFRHCWIFFWLIWDDKPQLQGDRPGWVWSNSTANIIVFLLITNLIKHYCRSGTAVTNPCLWPIM